MSEKSGLAVIKSNKEIKELFQSIQIVNKDVLLKVAALFGSEVNLSQGFEFIDDIEFLSLDIKPVTFQNGYALIDCFGFEWSDVFNIFKDIEGFYYWAHLSDSYGGEEFYAKSNKTIYYSCMTWEGSMDPEEDHRISELGWVATMNKTITKKFFSDDADKKLEEALAYKESQKNKVDHWRNFYKKVEAKSAEDSFIYDTLQMNLRFKNPDKRYFFKKLLLDLKGSNDLSEFKERYNSKFDGNYIGEYCEGITDEHIDIFKELYLNIYAVEENEDRLYVGFIMDDAVKYLRDDLDDNYRGYTNGKDFLTFSGFAQSVCDSFYASVISKSYKSRKNIPYFGLESHCGHIYLT